MSRLPGQGRKPRRNAAPVDPATALHRYAVKLFDHGDGRAVDWPQVAAALFKAGFACLDEAGGSERAMKVLRRIEAGTYNRLAGNLDDGHPYTTELSPRPLAGPTPEPSSAPHSGRAPGS